MIRGSSTRDGARHGECGLGLEVCLGVWLAVCLVYILLLLLVGRICVSVCDNIKWYNFHIKTEIPQEIFASKRRERERERYAHM